MLGGGSLTLSEPGRRSSLAPKDGLSHGIVWHLCVLLFPQASQCCHHPLLAMLRTCENASKEPGKAVRVRGRRGLSFHFLTGVLNQRFYDYLFHGFMRFGNLGLNTLEFSVL